MARSKELVPGVGRFSRSQVAAKRGLYKGLKKSEKPAVEPTPETVEKTIGGNNNGEKRIVPTSKAPRFYSAEDVRQPKKSRKTAKPSQLRSSITPGTVLILLAGRFRGKRVVFLKQLESGLLLVSGPYKVNGVPLRRVNQAYVIATSTKVELESIKVRLYVIQCLRLSLIIQYYISSLMNSTMPTLPSLLPRVLNPQKKSSSRKANLRKRRLSLHPKLLSRKRLTLPSSPPSRRLRTLSNTSDRRGVCQRASILIRWPSELVLGFTEVAWTT